MLHIPIGHSFELRIETIRTSLKIPTTGIIRDKNTDICGARHRDGGDGGTQLEIACQT